MITGILHHVSTLFKSVGLPHTPDSVSLGGRMMGYIDLMVDTDFIDEYWAALRIPGKEELFPSFYSSRKPGGIRKT